MKVIHIRNAITGTLVYSLKEKNKETIQGNMKGDILVSDYTFMSEVIQSTRQFAIKKEANQFEEGYGDFKNLNSLNFYYFYKIS